MKSFFSDYRCKPHPEVVQAVVEACASESGDCYGEDVVTAGVVDILRRCFGADCTVLFVSNGTAANRLALQTLLTRSYDSVICVPRAHINTYECGALESLGHKLQQPVLLRGDKLCPDDLRLLVEQKSDVHLTRPAVVSISNATEAGTVYNCHEILALTQYAHDYRLTVHLDGARMAYAAAHLVPTRLIDLTFNLGVDVVTFGGTKIGGMLGEAVIFKDPDLGVVAKRICKQQGQLCARQHLIAAQFAALFWNNLWLKLAVNANAMAQLLAKRCQEELGLKSLLVESNAVFLYLPRCTQKLVQRETGCLAWDMSGLEFVRFMCSWDTTEEDVNELVELIMKNMR